MTNSISHVRLLAARRQKHRCFYCTLPIWSDSPEAFISKYGLTKAQALQLRCTAEHLNPKSQGGANSKSNIVAACWYCNHKRHTRSRSLDPYTYMQFVQQRISKGRWLPATLSNTSIAEHPR